METNERAMKNASQAMIKALSPFITAYNLTPAQQIYVGIMVTGFLISEHKATLPSCIDALETTVKQYKGLIKS